MWYLETTEHEMACPQVAVRSTGENRNTVSNQQWTADEVWSCRLGVGRGANKSSLPKINTLKSVKKILGLR